MKTISVWMIALLFSSITLYAQSPPLLQYQGIARDQQGNPLANRDIAIRISILQNGANGTVVFSERHELQTNAFGLFTLKIGAGEIRLGAIDAIKWGQGSYWLQIELDAEGGMDYIVLGASQLLSVPYAFHATQAERLTGGQAATSSSSSSSPGTPWATTGNEGTDALFDFIGTSDRNALVFRTDNIERIRLTAYGNVGIGVDAPMNLLDVAGAASIGSGYAGSYEAPGNGLLVEGNVGIGEPHPIAALEVAGGVVVGSSMTGYNLPPLNGALFEGRVGIGTAGPGSKLSVSGGLAVGSTFAENPAPDDGAIFEGSVGVGTGKPKSMLGVAGNMSLGSLYARNYEAPLNGMLIQGDVGIGTPVPGSTLGVAGSVAVGAAYADLQNTTEDGAIIQGRVGIGTSQPAFMLDVLGDVNFADNLTLGKNLLVGGTLDVIGVTTLQNTKESTSADDGALVVKGGAGIGINLNVGESISAGGDLHVAQNSTLGGTLTVDGVTHIMDTTNSLAKSNGALVVDGGAGVKENVFIGGSLEVEGGSTFASLMVKGEGVKSLGELPDTAGGENIRPVALFENTDTDDADGIAIKLGRNNTNSQNQFITFYNGAGQVVGRIEGYLYPEDWSDPDPSRADRGYPMQGDFHWSNLIKLPLKTQRVKVFPGFDWGTSILGHKIGFDIPAIYVNIPYAIDPSKFSMDPTKLFNDDVYKKYDRFTEWAIETDNTDLIATDPWSLVIAGYLLKKKQRMLDGGITYQSKNADYAEWMPKEKPDEEIRSMQIVGIRKGKVSLNTENAELIMAVSTGPIVIGNTPPEGKESEWIKVGFVGQVPVCVVGPCQAGDFVLASGENDGVGVAVSPKDLRLDDLSRVLGRALTASDNGLIDYVDVMIGVKTNEWMAVLQRQQGEIEALRSELSALRRTAERQRTTQEDIAALREQNRSLQLQLERVMRVLHLETDEARTAVTVSRGVAP